MTPKTLFFILITLILIEFLWDTYLNYLNAKHYNDPIPDKLEGIFDKQEYLKSQAYKKTNYKFAVFSSLFSLVLVLLFFFIDGFAWIDSLARTYSENPIVISLIFIGILMLGNDLLTTPFSYYHTFVIEEKFGFNKSTKSTFWLDKLKGLTLMVIIGGLLLFVVLWFYEKTGQNFWIYTWGLVAFFSIFMTMFYSNLIVPLFNKQTPLEEGELKNAITNFAEKVGFTIANIFVIDGSKRSSKANAYFTGLGVKKRIVLYDTLINDLEIDEIVGVLAHEIGHYKKKHTLYNLLLSTLITGFTLFVLSFFINSPLLAHSLHVEQASFHIGIIVFGILYSPISEITGLMMNLVSRKFEYQADDFAKTHYNGEKLISSLKKLSKNSLSNLTPHPLYVFMHYSHPTLLQRIINLQK